MTRGAAALCLALVAAPLAAQSPSPSPPPVERNPVTNLLIFAGTRDGLWRTRNWGVAWERVKDKPLAGLGACWSIDAPAPQVYAGCDGGLYRSEDFGETWTQLADSGPIFAIMTSRYPMADPTLFLGTRKGLLKSSDGGRTFHETAITGTPVYRIEWPGPDLIVTAGNGVWISSDAAAHFRRPESGLPEGDVTALALSSFYVVDPVVYAAVGDAGIFRSADGGKTWSAAGLQGREVGDLSWLGPVLFAMTNGGTFKTTDHGTTWEAMGALPAGAWAERILFPLAPAGNEAFLATTHGVFWTGDAGEHWQPSGLSDQSVLTVATFPPPDPVNRKRR